MTNDDIKTKLTIIFRDVFDDDGLEIREGMTADDVEGWDSLSHITLIVAVEKGFSIKLSTRDVRSMKNVGDLIALIGQKAA